MRHLRVVLAGVGTLSVLFGILTFIVSIAWLLDMSYGDLGDVIIFVAFLIVAALLLGEGTLMFILPARIERATQRPYTNVGENHSHPHPEEVPMHVENTEQAEDAKPNDDNPDIDETTRMFHRSSDVFATARDIVRMHTTNPESSRGLTHLATMFATLNLEEWENAPQCEVALLNRTHSYWLRADSDELDDAGYDRFMATEAAMNLDLVMRDVAEIPYDSPVARQATAKYLREFASQQIEDYDFNESLGRAYPGIESQNTPGDWYVRASAVNDAECARVPFRLTYNFRCNVQAHVAVLSLEIPRPACFCIATPDTKERVAFARSYALRLSWLLASRILAQAPMIDVLEVQCHEHGGADVLLAIMFTRELVQDLAGLVRGTGIDVQSFPYDEGIIVSYDANGWFAPISPRIAWDSEVLVPSEWFEYPELSDRPFSERTYEVTGARCPHDLGINESAPRMQATDELQRRLQGAEQISCETVVAALVDIRDGAKDVSLVEACERAITALLNGSVDPTDEVAIRGLLVSDGALQVAVERAARLLEDDEHPDPQKAVEILREALGPILEFGFYADDESCEYRYFGSLSERIVYNTHYDIHTREVRLVPDSYYNALGLLASAYNLMEQSEDAIAIANEMIRIAPVSVDAHMRKVRALENESRILEAANLIRECAVYAATPRDAAFALYRLAYMEWKLGREDLAAACYVRALTWNTPFSEPSASELDDLLGAYPHLKRPDPDEAVAALAREGIPVGFTDAQRELTLTVATLMVDEHVFYVAQPLLAVVCAATGDDVYVGIRRTLDQ